MTPINESGWDSFLPDSTNGIGANLRVKLVTGTRRITPAGASDREIGVTKHAVTSRIAVPVRLSNAPGTVAVAVAGEVESGNVVKRAADGKVSVAGGGSDYGTADGNGEDEVVPVFPL